MKWPGWTAQGEEAPGGADEGTGSRSQAPPGRADADAGAPWQAGQVFPKSDHPNLISLLPFPPNQTGLSSFPIPFITFF